MAALAYFLGTLAATALSPVFLVAVIFVLLLPTSLQRAVAIPLGAGCHALLSWLGAQQRAARLGEFQSDPLEPFGFAFLGLTLIYLIGQGVRLLRRR